MYVYIYINIFCSSQTSAPWAPCCRKNGAAAGGGWLQASGKV